MSQDNLRIRGPLLVRFALWCLCTLVFPLSVTASILSFNVEVLGCTKSLALPPGAQMSDILTERVLGHLETAEKREPDPWFRDDYRISWITTLWSARGIPAWSLHRNQSAHVAATWQVLHCHPDEVWPRLMKRRKAMLGAEYAHFFPETTSPKKPCASVGRDGKRRAA